MSSSSDQNPFRVLGPLGPTLPLPPSYGPVRRNKRNPYEVENERVVREQQAMLLEEDLARRIRDHEWGTATLWRRYDSHVDAYYAQMLE